MPSHGRASLMEAGGLMIGQAKPREIVQRLEALIAQRCAAMQASSDTPNARAISQGAIVSTGWDAIDRALAPALPRVDSGALASIARGGLARSAVHEWLCVEEHASGGRRRWLPPHAFLIHLAWRAIEANSNSNSNSNSDAAVSAPGLVVWIGRRVWPHACALARFTAESTAITGSDCEFAQKRPAWIDSNGRPPCSAPSVFSLSSVVNLTSRSIFLDLPDDSSRLWAIDVALRNPAVNVIIADGSKLKMAESRRLQLASERGRALALLARPEWEAGELSAAATRWRVRRSPSPSLAPRWIVQLLRCKHGGCRSPHMALSETTCGGTGGWEIEYAAPGYLRLVADVVDRSDSQANRKRVVTLSRA